MNYDWEGIWEQAWKLKSSLAELKEKLAENTLVITAGENEVKIVINGIQEVIQVELKPEIIDPAKKQRLQMLLQRAINQSIARSREMAGKQVADLTGFDPGILDNLF
ncbi:MAG: YbaB/EbfC family nucleoid-associated protein [Bacillota bacterium]|jgi:DNA-binding YbaB/EbfC family protein